MNAYYPLPARHDAVLTELFVGEHGAPLKEVDAWRARTNERLSTAHFVNEDTIDELERIFVALTPSGWVIPDWLKLMRNTSTVCAV